VTLVFTAWFQHAFPPVIVTTLLGIVGRFSERDVWLWDEVGLEQKLGLLVG